MSLHQILLKLDERMIAHTKTGATFDNSVIFDEIALLVHIFTAVYDTFFSQVASMRKSYLS